MPEPVIRRLTREVAEGCERAVPGHWLWHGRHVLLATAMIGDVALQTIAASLGMLACATDELAARLIAAQLTSLTEQTVGDRPNRVEPRAVKRRPQPLALLTKPRHEARAELLRGTRT